MNLLKKTLFAAGILITLISLFACTSATVDEAGSKIADFDLPAGYTFEFNTSMLGYTVASYKGPNGPSHLYLIQSEQESAETSWQRCSHSSCRVPATWIQI